MYRRFSTTVLLKQQHHFRLPQTVLIFKDLLALYIYYPVPFYKAHIHIKCQTLKTLTNNLANMFLLS
jgi:hypothetical protein